MVLTKDNTASTARIPASASACPLLPPWFKVGKQAFACTAGMLWWTLAATPERSKHASSDCGLALIRLEKPCYASPKGVQMPHEIVPYGFTPGPPTKKDLEPVPEPRPAPMVQVFQQHPDSQKIISMLGVVIIMLVLVILLQNLGRAGATYS
jgi:hypothetical protein